MHNIIFYEDRDGYSQLIEYIEELKSRTDKDSRIKLNKINEYIFMLAESGTLLPANIAKHLDGEIWELRQSVTAYYLPGSSAILLCFFTAL